MKQAIVVRSDLGMGTGKVAAQAAHASLKAALGSPDDAVDSWTSSGMRKIVLEGRDEDHLLELEREGSSRGLPTALVRDAGHTEVEPGSLTALAVGPASDDEVDAVTGKLGLL
ncbi:MAG: peptidyl-tRNA hydrolase Pth2 [Halobacteriota archaeon]